MPKWHKNGKTYCLSLSYSLAKDNTWALMAAKDAITAYIAHIIYSLIIFATIGNGVSNEEYTWETAGNAAVSYLPDTFCEPSARLGAAHFIVSAVHCMRSCHGQIRLFWEILSNKKSTFSSHVETLFLRPGDSASP
jgi:hypothetical protein